MATLTLRPDSAGSETNWTPNTGANYAAVDEASNDGDTTYVSRTSTIANDTYNIPTSADLTGATINSVTVYASAKYVAAGSGSAPAAPTMYQVVRVGSTSYASSTADTLTTSYADTSNAWTTNPADSQAWEKADIDDLQIGIRSARTTGGGSRTYTPYCTQVWVVVDYTAPSVPDAPTNVSATDGTYTDKVTVTWTKSTGATGYKVYEGSNLLDTLGDVATYDDTAAPAPTITGGTASASDGTSTSYVTLSLSGESANVGTSRTYKVVAFNGVGDSADSSTNTGYRGIGSLGYQWYRSSGDADSDYSSLSGATTDPYNDTTAPEDGSGRYYKCYLTATGATATYSSANRGYRSVTASSTRLIHSIGKVSTSSTRAIYSKGKTTSSSTRSIYTKGALVGNSTRAIYTKGVATSSSTRSIYSKGVSASEEASSERLIYTRGSTGASSTRDIYSRGKLTSSSTRSIYTKGSVSASYSMENTADLEIDDTNLTTSFTTQNYTDVSTDDDNFVDLSGTATYFKYLFKEPNSNAMEQSFTVTAKVKSAVTTPSKSVYLQVYNRTTQEWETLDTESSVGANTEFTLTGGVLTGYEDYYDNDYIISCRVYQ